MTAPVNDKRQPPYKLAGLVLALATIVVLVLVFLQFRGDFLPRTQLTMMAARSGLSMDPGAKVTYNGVEIGRVGEVEQVTVGGEPRAKIVLEVNPKYMDLIPQNVNADISATTVFGNKYVSFSSPPKPSPQRITGSDVIDVTKVTTEFNTLFETVVSVAGQVDPIKLNQTLTATAQALDGLGDRFGQSIVNGNQILDDVNPRLPQLCRDNQLLADLADRLRRRLPRSVRRPAERGDHRAHPQRAAGQRRPGADGGRRLRQHRRRHLRAWRALPAARPEGSGAHLRVARRVQPRAVLHDPQLPRRRTQDRGVVGRQRLLAAHPLRTAGLGTANAYVYPDNLPRVNAKGGPEGRPGCWQPITRDLWPAPYLVMDTGASIAPYNHLELGQPILTEYVWGRQVGENTINP